MDFFGVLSAYGQAWTFFWNPQFVLFMVLGVIAGVVIGIIPALGGSVVNSVFLAFVFLLKPEQVLPFMVAVHATSFTGGAVTTVLLGIPGDSANAATLLDGWPMTKRGEAGRALGLALTADWMGSLISTVMALVTVPIILPMIIAIASPEMVFLVVMGLALIATLSRGSTLKGLISGFLGILVSLIGYNLASGVDRFTFGSLYLRDGIPVAPVFIGVFAIPEMISLATTGGTIAKEVARVSGFREIIQGSVEALKHFKLALVSSFIGYIIGILPGVGGLVAAWTAYGQVKQASKHPEKFGTGIPEGIIAPEAGHNSEGAGSVLTTLAVGIPGSSGMALIMAAMVLVGIVPGPEMMTRQLPFSISLLLVVAVAGMLAAMICWVAAPSLARVGKIPGHILVPIVIAIIIAGIYVSNQDMNDVIALFAFGVLGLLMKRYGFNSATFVLGYILGSEFEKFLFISMRSWGPLFFMRPISIVLIVVTIATVLMGYRSSLFKRAKEMD